MTGNALKRNFVGQAALAVKCACTITECHGETDGTFCKKYQNSKGSIHLHVSTRRNGYCEKPRSAHY